MPNYKITKGLVNFPVLVYLLFPIIIVTIFNLGVSMFSVAVGKTSNYAVVMAQLYSQGKHHGLHPFVVQLRSMNDHQPLPGNRHY